MELPPLTLLWQVAIPFTLTTSSSRAHTHTFSFCYFLVDCPLHTPSPDCGPPTVPLTLPFPSLSRSELIPTALRWDKDNKVVSASAVAGMFVMATSLVALSESGVASMGAHGGDD